MDNEKISLPVGRALEALRILERLASAPYPARAAYRIGRLLARLQMNPDITAAENSRRTTVQKFGIEKDGQISVPPEQMLAFSEDYGPVAATVVTLDVFQLPLAVFDDGPAIAPADMAGLQDFLTED